MKYIKQGGLVLLAMGLLSTGRAMAEEIRLVTSLERQFRVVIESKLFYDMYDRDINFADLSLTHLSKETSAPLFVASHQSMTIGGIYRELPADQMVADRYILFDKKGIVASMEVDIKEETQILGHVITISARIEDRSGDEIGTFDALVQEVETCNSQLATITNTEYMANYRQKVTYSLSSPVDMILQDASCGMGVRLTNDQGKALIQGSTKSNSLENTDLDSRILALLSVLNIDITESIR